MPFGNPLDPDNAVTISKFYEKILREVPDLIFQLKIFPDNTFQTNFISKSSTEIYGFNSEILLKDAGIILKKRIHPEDLTGFIKSILTARDQVCQWYMEHRVLHPEKGLLWLKGTANPEKHEDGSVIFYGRVSDITTKKEDELRLKISEKRFEFALEASFGGVWDWDINNDEVFYSNQSLKILEVDNQDISDLGSCLNRVHPDDREQYLADINNHLDGKTPFYENFHRVKLPNKAYKWILDRGQITERNKNGSPSRIIGTHTDIESQKQREEELISTLNLLTEQNNRLLNFAHIVSHNLRSHAGNLTMLLTLAEDEINCSNQADETFNHIKNVSRELNNTINHLSELANVHTIPNIVKSDLNLRQFLQRVLTIVREDLQASKMKVVNKIPEDFIVKFNGAYLESILLNLTTNAIKYLNPESKPEIQYEAGLEGNKKVLSITDNGLGIDLSLYGEALFKMHETFHQHPDSRGVGLYITKSQVEAMGGEIKVSSEVGKGTTFKIYFNEKV
ncbi:PAS domain-containing protein [Flavobacterium sp. NST-5]|uniref:histidine kinase n=1 Tax=Flavobacterium ichthyis TaxID=2698827 RepID=A0ABW9ZC47_9FLAO|nr:HAMP domain-containing sensor histidine kinase [Flavobacterium ichthyis]NBL64887.1 PAS domain-containing protein [Flavobacterium ichthyis]